MYATIVSPSIQFQKPIQSARTCPLDFQWLWAYPSACPKNKCFGFARSIRVNHFDSLLYLIRFRYEIMWVVLDPHLLDTPRVHEDK